jgi:hypothetical protein
MQGDPGMPGLQGPPGQTTKVFNILLARFRILLRLFVFRVKRDFPVCRVRMAAKDCLV